MNCHKGIEESIYNYLKDYPKNTKFVEIGIGSNTLCAEKLSGDGFSVRAADIRENLPIEESSGITFQSDDIFEPDLEFYKGADLIYSIRPGIEMVPSLIAIAKAVNCELIVYHLGCEIYGTGGEIIDTGNVILHRYNKKTIK